MNIVSITSGTKVEILEYLHQKIKKTIVITTKSFGEGTVWSEYPEEGEYFQFAHNTVEKQIDEYIQSGSPLVHIHLECHMGKRYRETFLVSDYSEIRIEMEIAKANDLELRQRRIEAIKSVMAMDLDAEERWNRILKVVDEFRGVSIPCDIANIHPMVQEGKKQ